MAKQEEKKNMTRAEKTEATKVIVKELLAVKFMRHNELIDEVARVYAERYQGEETENINDVKGRVGSVLDIMKKNSEIMYDGGTYALKARLPLPPAEKTEEKKPVKARVKKATKTVEKVEEPKTEKAATPPAEETPAPKKRTRAKKAEPAPVEEAPAKEKPMEEKPVEEKSETPKKRGRKPKAAKEEPAPVAETLAPVVEPVAEAPVEEKKEPPKREEVQKEEIKQELVIKPKAEVAKSNVVMDMSFLFGEPKAKPAVKREEKKEERTVPISVEPKPAPAPRSEDKPAQKREEKREEKPAQKQEPKKAEPAQKAAKKPTKARVESKPLTADEKLKESFLKKMRSLGGDYFEYYCVYLLERYSMKNGRRLEGLRISGGDHDGGIDGEIELTDSMGFKETIYIQSKNWDPDKGRGDSWVVGETLLQQFIGACACRQAKEGKQFCRGIFMTTSRFTPDAKRILEDMSEKIIGYDGEDLYEAAKECSFGVVKKGGEWTLDEGLLSGEKAFFHML